MARFARGEAKQSSLCHIVAKDCPITRPSDTLSAANRLTQLASSLVRFVSRSAREKVAFTLAEVLITLGIIGVVAAMTMPTLIQNHRRHAIETKLSKFYSTINQALKMSTVDNGSVGDWEAIAYKDVYDEDNKWTGITSTNSMEWYNKYLAPYIKVLKVEEDSLNKEGAIAIYLADGGLLSLCNSSWLYYPYAKDYKVKLGEDGKNDRDRSECGKKYFTFYFNPTHYASNSPSVKHNNNKLMEPYVPAAWDGTEEWLRNNSSVGCNRDTTNEAALCAKLIQVNGWKIPKDYPFGF